MQGVSDKVFYSMVSLPTVAPCRTLFSKNFSILINLILLSAK
ncbi:conserved hypothetical protein [Treponema phagedenis]|uniref:Uncharacterized protein n=1 Tax=Treponema phagedenis TaxID=162 RepID=A0A0B7GW37_TREPH|nr:conserved hypothetical protein [Treponema phagedenis]